MIFGAFAGAFRVVGRFCTPQAQINRPIPYTGKIAHFRPKMYTAKDRPAPRFPQKRSWLQPIRMLIFACGTGRDPDDRQGDAAGSKTVSRSLSFTRPGQLSMARATGLHLRCIFRFAKTASCKSTICKPPSSPCCRKASGRRASQIKNSTACGASNKGQAKKRMRLTSDLNAQSPLPCPIGAERGPGRNVPGLASTADASRGNGAI